MPITRAQKAAEIDQIVAGLRAHSVVYLTNHMGLNVSDTDELRTRFREAGIQYRVVKNTLLRRAMEEVGGYEAVYEYLSGPTAIALSTEPSTAARVIKQYKRATDSGLPELKAAVIDGALFAGDQIDTLASLKSKDEILGDVVGLLLSPIQSVVAAVQAPGATLAAIVQTLQEQDTTP